MTTQEKINVLIHYYNGGADLLDLPEEEITTMYNNLFMED